MAVSELHMQSNALTTLPATISSMPNIRKLYLNDNKIELLPTELWQLNNLLVSSRFDMLVLTVQHRFLL